MFRFWRRVRRAARARDEHKLIDAGQRLAPPHPPPHTHTDRGDQANGRENEAGLRTLSGEYVSSGPSKGGQGLVDGGDGCGWQSRL